MTLGIPDDLLPKWLLLVSAFSFFNSAQNFASIKLTQRVYSRKADEGN